MAGCSGKVSAPTCTLVHEWSSPRQAVWRAALPDCKIDRVGWILPVHTEASQWFEEKVGGDDQNEVQGGCEDLAKPGVPADRIEESGPTSKSLAPFLLGHWPVHSYKWNESSPLKVEGLIMLHNQPGKVV
jgi:hypothetical protein